MTKDQDPCQERGATSVEYALLLAFIAAVIIGSVTVFGAAVLGLFDITW